MFKANHGSKEIIASLSIIDPNEHKSCISRKENDEVIVENNDSSLPYYNEVADTLLSMREIVDNDEEFPNRNVSSSSGFESVTG